MLLLKLLVLMLIGSQIGQTGIRLQCEKPTTGILLGKGKFEVLDSCPGQMPDNIKITPFDFDSNSLEMDQSYYDM